MILTTTEQAVASHYGDVSLVEKILGALQTSGKDLNHLNADDLAPVDEFHIGGRPATVDVAAQMQLRPGMRLLDIGCGIGGPARYFAAHHDARVTGIDLTPEFIDTAVALTARLGLADKTAFRCGSALQMPFDAGSFDGAYIFHVGMNIADKPRLFAEVRRMLRPGAVFAVYEVMRTGEGELSYPVPWASTPDFSFVARPDEYRAALQGAGFEVASERSRRDFALDFFAKMRDRAASPLGLPLVMGETALVKIGNMIANLNAGLIAPVEVICRG